MMASLVNYYDEIKSVSTMNRINGITVTIKHHVENSIRHNFKKRNIPFVQTLFEDKFKLYYKEAMENDMKYCEGGRA
jgi:hypothetical protein